MVLCNVIYFILLSEFFEKSLVVSSPFANRKFSDLKLIITKQSAAASNIKTLLLLLNSTLKAFIPGKHGIDFLTAHHVS